MVKTLEPEDCGHPRRILVTGATRGIGKALISQMQARGLCPIAVGRWSTAKGIEAQDELMQQGCELKQFVTCDVADRASLDAACTSISAQGPIEGIISNAGVYLDDKRKGQAPDILEVSQQMLYESFCVNTWAPLLLAQYFVPGMLANGRGRIVIVSSGMGRCCETDACAPAYRLSKSASLMLTRLLASRLVGTGVAVHAACPGWARTRMGGPEAIVSVEEAAADVLFTYLHQDIAPAGALVRHGRELKCHVAQQSDRLARMECAS